MSAKFGSLFKKHRLAAGMTLREFCLKHGFDPGNLSRLERGRFSPPQSHEKLTEYAMVLGVESGSDEWQEFFDVAAVELGRIPPDQLDDGFRTRLLGTFRGWTTTPDRDRDNLQPDT